MRKKGYLEIKLKENKTISNMSHMFCRGIGKYLIYLNGIQ